MNCSRHTQFIQQEKGFTLIEMIVALAIIATGIAAAIGLVGSMVLNAGRLEEKAHAQWLMNNTFAEIKLNQLKQFSYSPFASAAVVEMAGREWHIFSQHARNNYPNSVETTITICLDQQRQDCVLEQAVYSSKKKVPNYNQTGVIANGT